MYELCHRPGLTPPGAADDHCERAQRTRDWLRGRRAPGRQQRTPRAGKRNENTRWPRGGKIFHWALLHFLDVWTSFGVVPSRPQAAMIWTSPSSASQPMPVRRDTGLSSRGARCRVRGAPRLVLVQGLRGATAGAGAGFKARHGLTSVNSINLGRVIVQVSIHFAPKHEDWLWTPNPLR